MNSKTMLQIDPAEIIDHHFRNISDKQSANSETYNNAEEHNSIELIKTSQQLNLESAIKTFSYQVYKVIMIDCIRYTHNEHEIETTLIFSDNKHSCSYNLVFEEVNLGKVTFYRNQKFRNNEKEQLERLLCRLVFPLQNVLKYQQNQQVQLTASHLSNSYTEHLKQITTQPNDHQQQKYSLMRLEIDQFNQFVAKYGQESADKALRHITDCIYNEIRNKDSFFRVDNAIIISSENISINHTIQIARRLQKAVAEFMVVNEGNQCGYSISIGMTESKNSDDIQSLDDRTKQALKIAKTGGKNKIVTI
ncbi:MAG: diguanylate cyclase [Methylococcales bacterium]|nr:diguanylate cyclase [Methylococcales bacterium]MBT7409884.1 diguanylate cyclase [Methylococcales bacterium]